MGWFQHVPQRSRGPANCGWRAKGSGTRPPRSRLAAAWAATWAEEEEEGAYRAAPGKKKKKKKRQKRTSTHARTHARATHTHM